jgi:ABC-type dipeptide/oligopeptide/nickel transport system permease component
MWQYIVKRLVAAIPTLLGIVFITFLLMKCVPGDPVYGLIGQRASPDVIERYRKMMGVDRNYAVQFGKYLKLLAQGDLGRSYYTNYPVSRSIAEKFPNTLKLACAAMAFAIFFGTALGIGASYEQNSRYDRFLSALSASGIALPVFWLGLLLIYIFSYRWHLLPPSGMGHGEIKYLVLPALTLGIRSMAYIARVMRSSMIDVLHENYIAAAMAKGMSRWRVVFVHALKNAAIPVVTLIGIDFASYLNGAVLTETIFGWDGLGRFAMTGIFRRDYPVILGTVLFGAVVFVGINILTDIVYRLFNPRIAYTSKK